MPSPFPGMDPYLEDAELWPEFHDRLLVAIADDLGPKLRPRYRVAIEKRVYQDVVTNLSIGRPGVALLRRAGRAQEEVPTAARGGIEPVTVELPMPEAVRERFLEVRAVGTGEVVTVIEVISPGNKRSGKGRQVYEAKRLKILGSQTHLVEIDLIRSFGPLPLQRGGTETLYRILFSRAEERPKAALYGFNLADAVPPFPLPLSTHEPDIWVDLKALIDAVYDRASYDLAIDYRQGLRPPLGDADTAWVEQLLQAQGLR